MNAETTKTGRAVSLLAAQPRIGELTRAATAAGGRLRFARGLRNGWEEARSDANILTAVHACAAQGLIVYAKVLRLALGQVDPHEHIAPALAVWRMGSVVTGLLDPLNLPRGVQPRPKSQPPAPQLLGNLWTAYRPHLEAETPFGLARGDLSTLVELLQTGGNAVTRAGLAWAHLSANARAEAGEAFVGAHPAGMTLARYVLATSGVEPTGTALLGYAAMADPGAYQRALAGYRGGSLDGVNGWLEWFGQAVETGAEAGERLAQSVLAGVSWDGIS